MEVYQPDVGCRVFSTFLKDETMKHLDSHRGSVDSRFAWGRVSKLSANELSSPRGKEKLKRGQSEIEGSHVCFPHASSIRDFSRRRTRSLAAVLTKRDSVVRYLISKRVPSSPPNCAYLIGDSQSDIGSFSWLQALIRSQAERGELWQCGTGCDRFNLHELLTG